MSDAFRVVKADGSRDDYTDRYVYLIESNGVLRVYANATQALSKTIAHEYAPTWWREVVR